MASALPKISIDAASAFNGAISDAAAEFSSNAALPTCGVLLPVHLHEAPVIESPHALAAAAAAAAAAVAVAVAAAPAAMTESVACLASATDHLAPLNSGAYVEVAVARQPVEKSSCESFFSADS